MFWNNSHTFYNLSEALGSFGFSPSSRSTHRLCCRTTTSTHFSSSTIYSTFHHIHCFRITGLQRQEQTITRAVLPRNQLPSVSDSQRGRSCEQIFDSSTTVLNPLVETNSLYGKRTVGFFLSPHTPYGRVRLARFARKALRPRFTDFFTDFEKKTDCFAV